MTPDELVKDALENPFIEKSVKLPQGALNLLLDIAANKLEAKDAINILYSKIEDWRKEYPYWFWHGQVIEDKTNHYCYQGTDTIINQYGIKYKKLLLTVQVFVGVATILAQKR
ncbi:hypothetical protein [Sporomusa sphaeroides]|uniref:Uncharacterized protein n=1 Tax=Sporomusa sphaeroides DSM 2875 TaxID=1337886 RepID=A0A1U7MA05_9FIRM|nr:hypothetical protein [Sporomusa sphaeroides]OLS54352.1 hypothetical protein SPSPH_45980 [Sporomusa sphaeroides DSM 2875]CVK21648.1 hypothetical protein SSPH_04343 [Sporomusa sphaeroides DSM 2875]